MSGNATPLSSTLISRQLDSSGQVSPYDNETDYSHSSCENTPPRAFLHPSAGLQHNSNTNHFLSDSENWQSHISYSASPDIQSSVIPSLPFSGHHNDSPIVTSSWSPQEALETSGWNDVSGMAPFLHAAQGPTYVNWEPMNSATSPWPHEMSSAQQFQSLTSTAPPPGPYRQQSFWAYKRQGAVLPPTFADMEMTAEIPYPTVYSPTSQIASTPVHPAFATNPGDVAALEFAVAQNLTCSDESILTPSTIKEAVSSARAKAPPRANTASAQTHSHGAVSKTKTAPKGGRVGPLTVTQREKVEDMRTYGACWRCRKYKKPCNGPGICNTCVTSGFRVWPSALGCRRGDFDSFAYGMIPVHAEQIVGQIVPYPKPPGWRKISKVYSSDLIIPQSAVDGDRFDQLMHKVQTTQLTGPGVMELLQIVCNLQRGLAKESRVLANTLKGLGHACDFYGSFVATDEGPTVSRGRFDMINIFTHNRKALLTTLSSFLNSCLTGRMKDWLPTFLSANFIVYTFVMLSDAAVMVPPQYRDKLWTSIRSIIMDFRGILYPMAQDLLSALGKGSKLLHMQCWNMVEVPAKTSGEESTWERNREGMKILDGDIAIFDGLRALQLWLERFGPLMRGDVWYSAAPHTVDVLPICCWERMFDFSPRG